MENPVYGHFLDPSVWIIALHMATESYGEPHTKYIVESQVDSFPLSIGFQGTSSFRDLLYNADIALVPCSFIPDCEGVLVHRGFQKRYLEIRDDIHDMIRRKRPHKVLLSGHSMGGALSQCCAMDLSVCFPGMFITCVTFGSPKCGNEEFSKQLEQKVPRHVRIFHQEDPIVLFPLGMYRHAGKPVCIHKESESALKLSLEKHSTKFYDLHLRKKVFDRFHILFSHRPVLTSLTRRMRVYRVSTYPLR